MGKKSKKPNKNTGKKRGGVFSVLDKDSSLVQKNPKLTAIVLVVMYWMLDYVMVDVQTDINEVLNVTLVLLSISTLYSIYVLDYQRNLFPQRGTDTPRFVKNKTRYVTIGWIILAVWGITFLIGEQYVVPKFFVELDASYHRSQILNMMFIAPVMEEIIFRYVLYDRWMKQKYGWLLGLVIASFLFVICHPVSNLHSLIIYYVPTLMFFAVYNEFGLYGSILIHMIYNIVAM